MRSGTGGASSELGRRALCAPQQVDGVRHFFLLPRGGQPGEPRMPSEGGPRESRSESYSSRITEAPGALGLVAVATTLMAVLWPGNGSLTTSRSGPRAAFANGRKKALARLCDTAHRRAPFHTPPGSLCEGGSPCRLSPGRPHAATAPGSLHPRHLYRPVLFAVAASHRGAADHRRSPLVLLGPPNRKERTWLPPGAAFANPRDATRKQRLGRNGATTCSRRSGLVGRAGSAWPTVRSDREGLKKAP
jgi:hypothetical protein